MPPAYVNTIREEILYEYAKLISRSAYRSLQRGFVTDRFKKLRDGEISMSGTIREWREGTRTPQTVCLLRFNSGLDNWPSYSPEQGRGRIRRQCFSCLPIMQCIERWEGNIRMAWPQRERQSSSFGSWKIFEAVTRIAWTSRHPRNSKRPNYYSMCAVSLTKGMWRLEKGQRAYLFLSREHFAIFEIGIFVDIWGCNPILSAPRQYRGRQILKKVGAGV